jgi:hypothetical protein
MLANDRLSNRLDGDAGHGDDRCKIFVWSGAAKGYDSGHVTCSRRFPVVVLRWRDMS